MNDPVIGPEICLEQSDTIEPLGLSELSPEEQELFTNNVNSPLKAPNQGATREGQHRDISGARKMSSSQGAGGGGTLASPIGTRPFGRRRDTSESFPFPRDSIASPSTSKFGREEQATGPPHTLMRRRTDLKDLSTDRSSGESNREEEEEEASSAPFGLHRRISTGPLSAGIGAPPPPWSSGGLGNFGSANTSQSTQKRPGGLNRSESRFKNIMNRESVDSSGEAVLDKLRPGLGTLSEDETRRHDSEQLGGDYGRRPGDDMEGVPGTGRPVGSAALGGAHDETSPEQQRLPNLGPSPSHLISDPNAANMLGGGGENSFLDSRHTFAQRPQRGDEPSSPTFTNPYQSPERNLSNLNDYDEEDLDVTNLLPGLGGLRGDINSTGLPTGVGMRGNAPFESQGFERTQGFPSASQRAFSGLGGLGTLPALGTPGQWPTTLGTGTPSRERGFPGFGDISGPNEEMAAQAFPGLGGLGPYGMEPGPHDANRGFGGSRLGSLFPSAMQDHPRATESMPMRDRTSEGYDPFAPRTAGSGSLQSLQRDLESPFATGPVRFSDSTGRDDKISDSAADNHASLHQQYSPGPLNQPASSHANVDQARRRSSADQDQGQAQSSQPPAAQQKTMVMPDRIRWIYRDPQGNTQGPWSGLEMHDWYRAGFFSPELLVKKVEDPDYEPLAQLIRRIGNSREPFLVPQIGIPGPPSTSGSWPTQPTATAAAPPVTTNAPSAQPPFASSFPSFGTTLTAEQQNALERRKQEEQYLMARQKEHLAQQQVLTRQRQVPGPGSHVTHNTNQQQPLHHHSSAHSLQSQPSYGSMTTPAYQGVSVAGNSRQGPGPFEAGYRGAAGAIGSNLEGVHVTKGEDGSRMMNQLGLGHPGPATQEALRQMQEKHGLTAHDLDDERIADMIAVRARLEQEAAEADKAMFESHQDLSAGQQRLQQFHELQDERGEQDHLQEHFTEGHHFSDELTSHEDADTTFAKPETPVHAHEPREHKLTLTEQVQKAASAKQSPAVSATQSPWTSKVDRPIAESHPSSQTSSPLPAPAARRSGRQSVADALAAESSKPVSPAVETPGTSVAPWARDATETATKQPSLKEIQEAEAQRAAKREEEQLALRRAALERELTTQPTAPAPGLPSSSNWASGESVTSPTLAGPSAWAKATAKTVASSSSKKSLSQIQKEEEALAKKRRAAAAVTAVSHGNPASATASTAQAVSAGKRYADLASKVAGPAPNTGNAWTTVGAGGKPKTPAAVATPATLQRAATGNVAPIPAAAPVKRPAGPNRINSSSAVSTAQDEFKKWAVGELRPDLNKGMNRK